MGDDDERTDAELGTDPDRRPPRASGGDKTVPRVDLSVRDLSVSVTGRSEDDLEAVEASAVGLMSFLVEEMDELEEGPDEYGLS
ncbi:hypothetical protein [Halolamina salifodinae]|uniref:Uncharacterized protein n=1 Tax=Halolamina salifodinae TaxID=1202767 RepID=A0A8T4GYK0_9EURY|nr:hypothetical protein [Halolamina salifodinae]MBP1988087.1 hypothetical protein [Halolamina salifodinae]